MSRDVDGQASIRAVVTSERGGPGTVRVTDVPPPEVGSDQVLVRVVGAAINPVDVATGSGLLAEAGLHGAAPVRLGWDLAGIVERVGPGTVRLRPGDRVVGLSDWLDAPSKAQAELVAVDEDAVAAVPDAIDLVEAAALPLAGLTAEQALDELDLAPGQSVLVTGAGGNVGWLAVQLARLRRLRVVATARPRHLARLRSLALDHVVVTGPDLGVQVRRAIGHGVDGVIDTANLGIVALDAVRNEGAYVGLVVTDRPAGLRGVRTVSIAVRGNWRQLSVLAGLVAAGTLRLPAVRSLPLEDVAAAPDLLCGVGERVVLRPA